MAEFVRVKFPNGNEASVPASFAESRGLKVIDKPATKNGRVLRDKPKVTVKKAETSNTTNPEGSDSSSASTTEESK